MKPARTQRPRFLIAALLAAGTLVVPACDRVDDEGHAAAGPESPAISLEAAIVRGEDEAVYAHLLAGTPINTPNATGDTPLSLAAVFGRVYATEVLLGAGADLETKNRSGVTPLFNAAFFCHAEVVRLLIDAGADTQTTDANGTPIRQVMEMPWDQIRPVYAAIYIGIGIPFDEDRIRTTRPKIAAMLH